MSKSFEYELTVRGADSNFGNGTAGDVQWWSVIVGVDARVCGGSLTLGQWHHIAGSYDGSAFVLYVDGVQAEVMARSGPVGTNGNPVIVGGHPTLNRPFSGDIDEVCIFNRGLSATEIQSAAGVELSGAERGLAGYYRFNEDTGQTAYDGSGNGNDGVLGTTWGVEAATQSGAGPRVR